MGINHRNTRRHLMSANCAKRPTWVFSSQLGGRRSKPLPFHRPGRVHAQRGERVLRDAQCSPDSESGACILPARALAPFPVSSNGPPTTGSPQVPTSFGCRPPRASRPPPAVMLNCVARIMGSRPIPPPRAVPTGTSSLVSWGLSLRGSRVGMMCVKSDRSVIS